MLWLHWILRKYKNTGKEKGSETTSILKYCLKPYISAFPEGIEPPTAP